MKTTVALAASVIAALVTGCESKTDECTKIGIWPPSECAEVLVERERTFQSRAWMIYVQEASYLRGYIDGKNGDAPKGSK